MSQSTDNEEILKIATERYKYAKQAWSDIYEAAKEDLYFLSDAPDAQWETKTASARRKIGRPTFTIDQLTQFVHQVSNDIRMNTPTIKCIPSSMNSDPKTAEAIQGRIKAIEYKSNADAAYDMAADFSVKSSLGFILVDHDYIGDGFEQELKILRSTNPLSNMIDPDSKEPDGSDAMWGFTEEEYSLKDFRAKWPKAREYSFAEKPPTKSPKETDKITVVQYFAIEETDQVIGLLEDGTTEPMVDGKAYKSTRSIKKRKVMRYRLGGEDVLESTTFPGKYIPIVPVYGEEAWEDGVRKIHSLIRKSKGVQSLYNLSRSIEAEILFKQQQAPVQAAEGQMEGYEEDWKHPDKAMVLYYKQKDVDGNPAPAPQRLNPPTLSTGYTAFSQMAENSIRQTLGMYSASAGKREGQASGVALKQLEQSSDVGNYHFGDNLVRSITHVGKILICALPEIEDSSRIVSSITSEDEHKLIGINGALVDDQEHTFDFTKADEYDVRVITGPSFTTQRQEAAATYNQIIQAMPDLMPVIGDLVFKYQDAPGSQAISARLKKLVDPKLLDKSDLEKDAPDPQIQQLQGQLQQITQQAQQEIQQLQTELKSKEGEQQVKMAEVQIKAEEVKIKQDDMKLKYITALQPQQKEASAPTQSVPLAAADESIEVLQARIMQKAQQDEQTRVQAEQTAHLEATKAQREYEQEQQELQLQLADMQARDMQARALVEGISGIQQTLGVLVQSVQAPIDAVYDESGKLIRIN
ncbi:Phage P22-like portal protein [uncultured Caudovirales phage]|uniref:Phage P22-like portal protein n=1 Tax=uncultured Caudovirales phage TaxID=2100421 RepID=A0A6J7WF40_9CAUD|nr:Phage P22-like portal protein [uncultured Caudovirales phage]